MAVKKDQKKSYSFQLKSSTEQITKTIQHFDELLDGQQCCSSREKSELSTALSEALANAIIHGNKIQPQKKVALKIQFYSDMVKINVADQGKGFDLKKIESPLKEENLKKTNGRGIYLMTLFMDDVSFKRSKNGMQVTLIKNLQKK